MAISVQIKCESSGTHLRIVGQPWQDASIPYFPDPATVSPCGRVLGQERWNQYEGMCACMTENLYTIQDYV